MLPPLDKLINSHIQSSHGLKELALRSLYVCACYGDEIYILHIVRIPFRTLSKYTLGF